MSRLGVLAEGVSAVLVSDDVTKSDNANRVNYLTLIVVRSRRL